MAKMHIDEVFPKKSLYPLIVNFQNGYTSEKFRTENCMLFNNNNTRKKCVAAEIESLVYSGEEETDDLGKTMLLVRDKITGKVRILEVSSVNLKPVFREENKTNTDLDNSNLELSRKFGSKRQKKQVEQKEKLKVNIQVVTEQMHNVTANITEDQLDISAYDKTGSEDFYIPPINREATSATDVYDLYKILSKEEYEKIYSEIEGKDYQAELLPWLKNIVSDRKLSDELLVLSLYANSLFKIFSVVVKDIAKKGFVICTSSPTLNDIVLKNFTTLVNNRRSRPLQFKDKAFCHALVFLLLINNMKFDVEEVSKNTKYSPKTLLTKVRVVGATIVSSGEKKIAHLKLPLSAVPIGRRKSAKF